MDCETASTSTMKSVEATSVARALESAGWREAAVVFGLHVKTTEPGTNGCSEDTP
jgi:hypothetical protein